MAYRIELEEKGLDLIASFGSKYALNGEISVWRGNKLLVTPDLKKAYKLHCEAWQKWKQRKKDNSTLPDRLGFY